MVVGDSSGSTAMGASIHGRATSMDPVSLVDAMEALDPVDSVWAGPGGPTILTSGRVESVTAGGEGRFRTVRDLATQVFERIEGDLPDVARPRLLGGFAFFGTDTLSPPWESFEPAAFHLPAVQVVLTDEATWITVLEAEGGGETDQLTRTVESISATLEEGSSVSGDPGRGSMRDGQAGMGQSAKLDQSTKLDQPVKIREEALRSDRKTWISRVKQITDTIESGVLRKAVLAQALDLKLGSDLSLESVLRALGTAYPDCYRFAFHGRGPETGVSGADPPAFFFGASPETLVTKSGAEVSTEALAGTVERGETSEAEEENAERLQTDPKIQEEHDLVVERVEHQLASIGTNVRLGERSVRQLPTVQHLRTPLSARVGRERHILDIVEALHPTPAVGGMPPDAAKAVIRDLESVERGWYAAPVGWFDAEGAGTFAVAIRSALSAGTRATLFAGNGIVQDSNPGAEWEEVRMKFRPIRNALR